MLNETIQQIYNMLYSPVVSLYSLVDNAKLDNYEYVNYSKVKDELLVTMRCMIDNTPATFSYWFDKNDYLQKAIMETPQGSEILFDRRIEIQSLQKRYKKQKQLKVTLKVI